MDTIFLFIILIIPLIGGSSYSMDKNNTNRKEIPLKMLSEIKGSGSPILLVPGGLTGWISWDSHAKQLSSGREVIQVQLINVEYGYDNRPLPPDYSVKLESDALGETIDSLGLSKPIDIVAWSYGAAVTLDYVLSHPERVRTLTLIEPPAFWVLRAAGKEDEEIKAFESKMMNYHGDITDEMLEDFMGSVGFLAPGQKAQSLPQWKIWLQYKQSLRNNPYVVTNDNDINKVAEFNKPVLLVKGTGSAKFLHKIIDTLGKYFPNNKIIELPGGHAPQIVSIIKFLEILKDFQSNDSAIIKK